jgi:hypothetical protein
MQNCRITCPSASASAIFIIGIPSALDSDRRFLTSIDTLFSALERQSTRSSEISENLVKAILSQNCILGNCIRQRFNATVEQMECFPIDSINAAKNLAMLINAICARSAE